MEHIVVAVEWLVHNWVSLVEILASLKEMVEQQLDCYNVAQLFVEQLVLEAMTRLVEVVVALEMKREVVPYDCKEKVALPK